MKQFWVYIITNKNNTVLYIGITSDLTKRLYEHNHKLVQGFSAKYNLGKLIYFEEFVDPENAILREKQLKKWNRAKKERLINTKNPEWTDLGADLL